MSSPSRTSAGVALSHTATGSSIIGVIHSLKLEDPYPAVFSMIALGITTASMFFWPFLEMRGKIWFYRIQVASIERQLDDSKDKLSSETKKMLSASIRGIHQKIIELQIDLLPK
jgi:hypothetical protein